MKTKSILALAIASSLLAAGSLSASSHREAPLILKTPLVDGTDFYMFRSYEEGRQSYTTILANYSPVQDPAGGPLFFPLEETGKYEINIDNNGDAISDLTFRFRFRNFNRNITIPVGGQNIPVPVLNIAPFDSVNSPALNRLEAYTVETVRPGALPVVATNTLTGKPAFIKPTDNIGTKSIPGYARFAEQYIGEMQFEGCSFPARVFVSQRREGFSVALGEAFDLFNLNPLGAPNAQPNDLEFKNVTSIALEVPTGCLTQNRTNVIGGWTTAFLPRGGVMTQVSRLANPLVNEVVIGVPEKDKFNASEPRDDAQFARYVTNPVLPEILQALFPVVAPNTFPRTDLVSVFLTGIPGLNQAANFSTPAELMRLNVGIFPKTAVNQSRLGVLGGDTAGFPNGRRPGDDVVDIELRVLMGVLLSEAEAPSGQLPFTDGAITDATRFRNTFPYLNTPIPGDFDLTDG